MTSDQANVPAWSGDDPGVRGVSDAAFRGFVAEVAEVLELVEGESVFDVCCGAGALLSPLHDAGCRVGGLDPSGDLIATARDLMPEGRWFVGDAAALDPADAYDVVVACGAFQRFPDHEYARGVLARMTAKATRAVAILDVPDAGARAEALALGQAPGALAFERLWFLRMLDQMGASAIRIGHRPVVGYAMGEHRFQVFAKV